MMARDRRQRSSFVGRTAYLLIALAALSVLLVSVQPLHVHGTGRAAFYNEECPLAELAARHGQFSLPSAAPAVGIGFVVHQISVIEIAEPPAAPVPRSQPRAPPIV